MGEETTGNARALGYDYPPIVRMSNTYIEAGDDSFEEMMKLEKPVSIFSACNFRLFLIKVAISISATGVYNLILFVFLFFIFTAIHSTTPAP